MIDLKEHLEVISQIKERISQKWDGKIVNLMVSGAHLYGFESPDSDIDYRGTFIFNTRKLLGMYPPKEVLEAKIDNNDVVLFEIRKEIGLALKGNCNVLEHLNANQLMTTHWFVKLKQAINNAWGKMGYITATKAWLHLTTRSLFCKAGTLTRNICMFSEVLWPVYMPYRKERLSPTSSI